MSWFRRRRDVLDRRKMVDKLQVALDVLNPKNGTLDPHYAEGQIKDVIRMLGGDEDGAE